MENNIVFDINDFNEFTEKKLYLDVLKNINFEQAVLYIFNFKYIQSLSFLFLNVSFNN